MCETLSTTGRNVEIRIQLDNGHGDFTEFQVVRNNVTMKSDAKHMEEELEKLVERAKDWIRNV